MAEKVQNITHGKISPRTSDADENVDIIWDDRCLTDQQLVMNICISSSLLHAVLIENLDMNTMFARWILRMLTPEQMV